MREGRSTEVISISPSALDHLWPLRAGAEWRLCQRVQYDLTGWSWVLERGGAVISIDTMDDPSGIGQHGFSTELFKEQGSADALVAAYLTSKRIHKAARWMTVYERDRPFAIEWQRIRGLAKGNEARFRIALAAIFGRRLALLSDAERHLTSSMTGLLIAASPIIAAVLDRFTGGERLGFTRILGLGIGIAGVAVLAGPHLGGSTWPIIEVLLVATCYAIAPLIVARYLAEVPTLPMTAVCLGFAALVYAAPAAATWPDEMPSTRVLLALAGLGVICTALAFIVFFCAHPRDRRGACSGLHLHQSGCGIGGRGDCVE